MKRTACLVVIALSVIVLTPHVTALTANAASTPMPEYVLWSKGAMGQAILWGINPTDKSMLSWAWISPPEGVGGGWVAVSYTPVSSTEGYVLWTNNATGQTIWWNIKPTTGSVNSWSWLSPPVGVGGGWKPTYSVLAGGTLLNGTEDPFADDGKDGDCFINTTSNTLFGPKTADGWGIGTRLVGPQGEQGPKGDKGEPGIPGSSSVAAYSGNDEYLGLLLGISVSSDRLSIYVPSLNRIVGISENDGDFHSTMPVYYSGENCTGTMYMETNTAVVQCGTNTYCTGDDQPQVINPPSCSRNINPTGYDCYSWPPPCGAANGRYYIVKTVVLPFSVPVTLPIKIGTTP